MATSGSRSSKFIGSFLHQLDEKGRVSLPASFRREVPDQSFVLVQPYPPALALYPESEWSAVEERLRELVKHRPEARMWVLSMMTKAVEVVPDSQGRILIPSRLVEAAGLDGQVQMVGAIDKVELWNPERFEAAVSEEAEDFSQFAPQVFR